MALKFLNKKGWHTGSLRNIENVWKAEQKHAAEEKKLEELRQQIKEEHERAEFRRIQEQAGLAPRQERLDFLYESGLAVGKGSSEGFKALQAPAAASSSASVPPGEGSSSKAAVPGALFEDKPQSANDVWRKLHSDPLLLIRQREQEALARIKNNPIKMAMIKKSVEAENKQKQDKEKRKMKKHKDRHRSRSKDEKKTTRAHSGTEDSSVDVENRSGRRKSERQEDNETREDEYRKTVKGAYRTSERKEIGKSKHEKLSSRNHSDSEDSEVEETKRNSFRSRHDEHIRQVHLEREEGCRRNKDFSIPEPHRNRYSKPDKNDIRVDSVARYRSNENESKHDRQDRYSKRDRNDSRVVSDSRYKREENERKHDHSASERHHHSSQIGKTEKPTEDNGQNLQHSHNRHRGVPKMSEGERAARLREMQMDAELHEEQRWKRLKKAAEADAHEAMAVSTSRGKTFLDAAQKSIYGAEEGGSTTIEESVRRRAYYSQGSSAHESNAFRR